MGLDFKSQVLEQQDAASAEDVRECPGPEPEQVNHDGEVTTDGILDPTSMFLISRPDGIVANGGIRTGRTCCQEFKKILLSPTDFGAPLGEGNMV